MDPNFCKFVSDRSVGRRSAGRRITDHVTRQQSHGRRRSRRVHLSRAVLAPPVLGEGVPGIGRVGIRPRFGDRPISHAEWRTSTGAAGPPTWWVGSATHRSTDDDSRYRFARYELSEPKHSRRGRPSSPCPAVAGAKPRDDGLRVASRLPPRSRLGTVTKRARAAIPAGRPHIRTVGRSLNSRQREYVATRAYRVGRPPHVGRSSQRHHGRGDCGRVGCPRVSQRIRRALVFSHEPRSVARRDPSGLAVVRPPSASARPRADRRSDARVPSRASARVTGRSCCKTEIPG